MADEQLVTVRIDTRLGAHYEFPDVARTAVELCVPTQAPVPFHGAESLMLINASGAWLNLPTRIIVSVRVDDGEKEEVLWRA